MADGRWIQYNNTDKRFDSSTDGGDTFTELDLSGQDSVPQPTIPPDEDEAITQTTTSTGTQNNFAQTAARNLILRCNNASLLTITGFAAGNDGDNITVVSIGAGQVDFAHQNTGSTAANRLINFVTSCITPLAAGVGTAKFVYDASTARWRLVAHEQGAWIHSSIATIVANGGGSVGSFSYSLNKFYLKGRDLTWMIYASFALTGGTVSSVELLLPITGATIGGHHWNYGYASSAASVVGCRTSGNLSTHLLFQLIVAGGGVANLAGGGTGLQGVFHVEII